MSLSQSLSLESVPSPALWTQVWALDRENFPAPLLPDLSNSGGKGREERKESCFPPQADTQHCGSPRIGNLSRGQPKRLDLSVCTCESPMGTTTNAERGCFQGTFKGRCQWSLSHCSCLILSIPSARWALETFRLYCNYVWVKTNSVCQMPPKYWIHMLVYFYTHTSVLSCLSFYSLRMVPWGVFFLSCCVLIANIRPLGFSWQTLTNSAIYDINSFTSLSGIWLRDWFS